MGVFDFIKGKDTHTVIKNPFEITKEEIETSTAFLKEAKVDLAIYDELEKSNFLEEMRFDLERRKIFLLQQAEEKAVKSALPYFVRITALPLLSMGVFFDEPPIGIRRVIEIYKKRTAESLKKTFNKKRLGHGLSKSFEIDRLFEDFIMVLTLIYRTDLDVLEYVNESAELIKSRDLNKILKGQEANKLLGSLEEIREKMLKYQQEGYNKENAAIMTRYLFAFTAVSLSSIAQNIGLLNILEDYEQNSRYPDMLEIKENDPILLQKTQIRDTIVGFIKVYSQRNREIDEVIKRKED
jgi:hypothetical protein